MGANFLGGRVQEEQIQHTRQIERVLFEAKPNGMFLVASFPSDIWQGQSLDRLQRVQNQCLASLLCDKKTNHSFY